MVRALLLELTEEQFPWKSIGPHSNTGVVGIVAAGGGAYVANRHNEAELVQPAPMLAVPTAGVVTETENTIATPAAAVEPAPQVIAPESAPAHACNTPRTGAFASGGTRSAASRARASPNYGGNSGPSSTPAYTPSNAPVDPPVSPALEPLETQTSSARRWCTNHRGRCSTAGGSCRLSDWSPGGNRCNHRAGKARG